MQKFSQSLKLMGNNFTITVVAETNALAAENIDLAIEEIRRIEQLFTTYNNDSQTSAIKMVYLINYKNIILDKQNGTVFLKEKGMRIGFGGIGKGYAAEMAKKILMQNGIRSGIINASGDLSAWGFQPNGKQWTIGIANPDFPQDAFSYLEISNKAIATSGNYEKYVTIDGKKYSHTIDPKKGMPITGIKSVTIISDNAEFADAMATPIAVMGIEAGLFLIDQIPDLHCIIIDDNNKLYTSKNINLK